jgi:hypothetical protein
MSAERVAAPLVPASVAGRIIALPPMSLGELEASAGLLTRTDRKYIIEWHTLDAAIDAIGPLAAVLEIGGRRTFAYHSRYFDSPSLEAFRAHIQGRRKRYKCRVRHYVDIDRMVFEVKLKGRRGQTVKHRLDCPPDAYDDPPDEPLRAFASRCVGDAYGKPVGTLCPTLDTYYQRMTLVARDGGERVTVDYGVVFADGHGRWGRLEDGYVIVETKGAGATSRGDQILRGLGARPVQCSKYCIGISLLRKDVNVNDLRWLLGRYFAASAPQDFRRERPAPMALPALLAVD